MSFKAVRGHALATVRFNLAEMKLSVIGSRALSPGLWVSTAVALAFLITPFVSGQSAEPSQPSGLYDANPEHLWNRLHRALFLRQGKDGVQYGYDDTVPFNRGFGDSFSLLTGEPYRRAIALLDEFLSSHGEELIRDPVKRAVLQHDLWAAFDNAISLSRYEDGEIPRNGRALAVRLAHCIQRLALTGEQIKALPDNYALAVKSGSFGQKHDPEHPEKYFLPSDLFDQNGSWVEITETASRGEPATAPVHVECCSGRSAFQVFMRLPSGRAETLAYLDKLNMFSSPWELDPAPFATEMSTGERVRRSPVQFNSDTPQFPSGTMVALVRRMMLVSDKIEPIAAPLIESVQLRVYRKIPPAVGERAQDFYEIDLRRAKLFATEAGGLRPLGKDEKEPNLLGMPTKFITVKSCLQCHSGDGIFSVQSYTRGFAAPPVNPQLPPAVYPDASQNDVAEWKTGQFDWGLLTGLLDH